jgi:hypothetical protein
MYLKVAGHDSSGIALYDIAAEGEDFDAVIYALTDDPLRPIAIPRSEWERQQALRVEREAKA